MLQFLLYLLLLVRPSQGVSRPSTVLDKHQLLGEATSRPLIHLCRSRNMEDFSCWWHPLTNLSDAEQPAYVLTYSIAGGPRHECPDYKTSGPDSCHFDRRHTTIWQIFCLNVTAITARGNYTSPVHCLDVADIVQMEAPVNLTYKLVAMGGDEVGHSAELSWSYPVPSDIQNGWITLEYELQYRRVGETNNWKEKSSLHEPQVQLIGLPVSDYVVRVRCRSTASKLWSNWSGTLLMSVPAQQPSGKFLALILVMSIGGVALLVVMFGIIPQSKRIKDFFLPPIPKPRIIGIDPLLLKKGHFAEINRHLSSFHGYHQPIYSEEIWDCVSADIDVFIKAPKNYQDPSDPTYWETDALVVSSDVTPSTDSQQLLAQNSFAPNMSAYCSSPQVAFAPASDAATPWPQIVTLPGTEYSMMGGAGVSLPENTPAPPQQPPQDFYSCVHVIKDGGEVHLVPCLPSPAHCSDAASSTQEADNEKMRQKEEGEKSNTFTPLLPTTNLDLDTEYS
ncbi:growth hormone receptor isoform 1-T1 [Synchiropus picturatus]